MSKFVINQWCACTTRVTVLGLWVCLSVSYNSHTTSYAQLMSNISNFSGIRLEERHHVVSEWA